jgi:hypothetical protein
MVPESRSKIMKYFDGVTEHMIRTAREGMLSSPTKKLGSKVKEDVVELIENSRKLPGQRDCVSVSRNVLLQKRLVLFNLRELYDKCPAAVIGLAKFCELRPKWCVMQLEHTVFTYVLFTKTLNCYFGQ